MKLNFAPSAGSTHSRCLDCGRETLRTFRRDGRLLYHCDSCGQDNFRALIIDPKVKWWVDDTCEYWHETAGIFLADSQGRFLLFERMQYPFGLAVTAGHVDTGESPLGSAQRELYEETGVALRPQDFCHIAADDIYGDGCRRGADVHRWHSFVAHVPSVNAIRIDPREGVRPVWVGLRQALYRNLTFATRYVIKRHAAKIIQAVSR